MSLSMPLPKIGIKKEVLEKALSHGDGGREMHGRRFFCKDFFTLVIRDALDGAEGK